MPDDPAPSEQPNPAQPTPEGQSPAVRGSGTRMLGAGMTFAASMAVFALGGFWLDGKLGTKPWLTLVGCLCGLVGGTIHMLNAVAPETLPFGRRKGQGSKDS